MRWRAFWLILLFGCGARGPREVRGPDDDGLPPPRPPPAAALLVVAEHSALGGHLVVIDETGRRQRNLTDPPTETGADSAPALSRDGRWVVYASSRGRASARETSLFIVAADGKSAPRRLTDDPAIDVTPAFAPDGRSVAFGSTRAGDLDLWIVELDVGMRPAAPRRLTQGADADYQPAWSHGGELIAYTRHGKGAEPRVMVTRADGAAAPRPLATGSAPEFSPDDASLVFAARPMARQDLDLFIVPVAGGEPRRLTDLPLADESGARYSPDGRFLFATAVVRDDEQRLLTSTIICLEPADPATLRALVGPLPVLRLGVAVGPGALDVARLRANPTYAEAIRRAVAR